MLHPERVLKKSAGQGFKSLRRLYTKGLNPPLFLLFVRRKKAEEKVHNPSKRYENALKVLEKSEISGRNKDLIKEFVEACIAEGIGKLRVTKYIFTLRKIASIVNKDFDEVTRDDMVKLVRDIELSEEYSEWTKHDYKVTIKKFYKWLKGNGEEYPPEVKWIKTGKKINNNTLPDELITPDEIKKMANVATSLRDRAIILTLYESGARAGELLSMKIKHVVFDKYGALVMLQGKTGMRRVRLVASVPALSAWLDVHPFKDDKEAWLWVGTSPTNRNERLSYAGLNKLLNELAKKAGVKKAVNPHNFRHSRATELAKHLTEAQLCQIMGWVQGSKQASTYVHLSQRDTDKAILGLYGLLEKEESEEEKLMAIKCPRCRQDNYPGSRFCRYCGMALDIKSAMEAEDRDKQVGASLIEALKDPEVAKKIIRTLEDIVRRNA